MQGEAEATANALAQGRIEGEEITARDAALLRFVRQLTLESEKNTAQDIQTLRDAGWTDDQIAEAVHITALFAFFNRVASAFGLEDETSPPPS